MYITNGELCTHDMVQLPTCEGDIRILQNFQMNNFEKSYLLNGLSLFVQILTCSLKKYCTFNEIHIFFWKQFLLRKRFWWNKDMVCRWLRIAEYVYLSYGLNVEYVTKHYHKFHAGLGIHMMFIWIISSSQKAYGWLILSFYSFISIPSLSQFILMVNAILQV